MKAENRGFEIYHNRTKNMISYKRGISVIKQIKIGKYVNEKVEFPIFRNDCKQKNDKNMEVVEHFQTGNRPYKAKGIGEVVPLV